MTPNTTTTEKRPLPRMRTIAKALEEISAADPNTALTQNQLRKLVKSGAIPCVHAGRHTLINLDILIAYLASDEYQQSLPANMAKFAVLQNKKDLSSYFSEH